MSTTPRSILWESWGLAAEADRRFRRIVAFVTMPALAFAVLMALSQFEAIDTAKGALGGARYVEVVAAQAQAMPPVEQANSVAQSVPELAEEPAKPLAAQRAPPIASELAPKKPEKAPRILVVQRGQHDLNHQRLNTITSQQPLVSAMALQAAPVAADQGPDDPSRQTDRPRDLEEVVQVFERNKESLDAIYDRRTSTSSKTGSGEIVIAFTIASNGAVTDCSVVSSTFNDPEFERSIVAQIRLFRFPSKNVLLFSSPNYRLEFRGA